MKSAVVLASWSAEPEVGTRIVDVRRLRMLVEGFRCQEFDPTPGLLSGAAIPEETS
jgi:hypothetical protein